jgi:potassium efflux system protein
VTIWTLSDLLRRVTLPVAVAYTADPERVLEVLGDVVKAHPRALADPAPVVLCTGLDGSALNFDVRVWTARSDEAEALASQLALNVHAALTAAKIDLAVPQRDVHLRTE